MGFVLTHGISAAVSAANRLEGGFHHGWEYTDVDRVFWKEHLESWLPHRIFDAHTHVNEPCFRVAEPTEALRRQYWVSEVNEPIGADDAQHCHETVFPGRDVSCLAFGHPSLDYDIESSNASLQAGAVKRGWHSLTEQRPQWSAEQVDALLCKPGVAGVNSCAVPRAVRGNVKKETP